MPVALLLWLLPGTHGEREFFIAPQHSQRGVPADGRRVEQVQEVVVGVDGLPFQAGDDVARFYACSLGRAVRGDVPYAGPALELAACQAALHHHAEVGAAYPPLRYEREDDAAERAGDRDGEAYALRAADDGRVDADHAGRGVGQGTARVARVDRGVCLYHVLYKPAALAPDGTAEGTDHARRDAPLEAERIPDGDDELADYEVTGVAERGHCRLLLGVETDDGKIARRVVAKHLGGRR